MYTWCTFEDVGDFRAYAISKPITLYSDKKYVERFGNQMQNLHGVVKGCLYIFTL